MEQESRSKAPQTMRDVLRELFAGDTDHDQARIFAKAAANLVGSQVLPNDEIIVNEPYYPFKVSFHNKQFHCFLLIADASYCFSAKRRSRTPWAEDFAVGLKEPYHSKGARILSPELSAIVGVEVYRQPVCADSIVEEAFSEGVLSFIRKIQWNRVQQGEFSPIALRISASLDSPEVCVSQALVFRELVTCANREAYERNKEFLS